MLSAPDKIKTWQMARPAIFDSETNKTIPGILEKTESPLLELVETRPMSAIADTFEENHKNPPDKRIVLTPDF